jgi:hypothetical protein
MSGWICLHRKLLDWEWYSDHNTKILFIHCLLRANHSDTKWKGQAVKRGQFITSLESLSKETGLTISQVRTSIKKLKSTSEIAEKSQARSRVVTVLEYDTYQVNRKQFDSEIAGSSQDNRSEIATDNNDNNKTMKTKVKRFFPPTVEEVAAYCRERNNGINPQKFVDHYKTNDWKRGNTKIKDWQACVRTWEKRSNTEQPRQRPMMDDILREQRNGI